MSMATQVDAGELLTLLESTDLQVVSEIERLVKESLCNSKESWLLNGLVDSYVVSQSQKCMEILVTVQEPHDKHLLDKVSEHLKTSHRLQALTLFSHIVHKQPPWLHKVARHPVLSVMLRCLKTDTEVPVLMTGLLILAALLPNIPVTAGPALQDVFEAFTRLAAFNFRKPGNVPEVYMLHLQVGLYSLFHRLYGMYPCNFLTYLRATYGKKENLQVFEEMIMPMLERVRMHPLLVTATKDKEIATDRWRHKEVHDILVDCTKLSLDVVEGTSEDSRCPVMFSHRTKHPSGIKEISQPHQFATDPSLLGLHHLVPQPAMQHQLTSEESTTFWSPANVCGLSTPPPTRAATATPGGTEHLPGSVTQTPQRNTPQMGSNLSGPLESPLPHDSNVDKTPTSHPQMKKRLSLVSLSLAGKMSTPTEWYMGESGGGSVPPSPLKPDFTSEPPLNAQRMQAIRKIQFVDSHSHDGPEPGQGEERNLHPLLMRKISDKSQEWAESLLKTQSVDDKSSQLLMVAPSSEQKLGSLGNQSQTSRAQLVNSDTKLINQTISGGVLASDPTKEGKLLTDRQVPSIADLSQFIDSLDVAQDVSQEMEDADKEVSSLTNSHLDGTSSSDSETGTPSHFPPDIEMTAESVAAFMKQVNRIRFNSINVVRHPKPRPLQVVGRPHSCPDLDAKYVISTIHEGSDSEACSRSGHWANKSYPATGSGTPSSSAVCNAPIGVASQVAVSTATATAAMVTQVTTLSTAVPNVMSCSPEKEGNDTHASNYTDMPYGHLLPLAMPFAPYCSHVKGATSFQVKDVKPGADSNFGGNLADKNSINLNVMTAPLFMSFSPPDLLDRHLESGGETHAKELAQLPLTSHGTVSWTHFGGVPPSDEVNILRGQIFLLHNQLMFERHRRELHAKRNRRLLGRIVKIAALEEQKMAMQDQMRLQENEIQNLNESLRKLHQEHGELKQAHEAQDYHKEVQQKSFMLEIETLQDKNKELKGLLEAEQQHSEQLDKELQNAKAQVFKLETELKSVRLQAALSQELQEQVAHLNKELLLMGELQQKYQQRLVAVSLSHHTKPETQFVLDSYKTELAAVKLNQEQKITQLELTRAKLSECEEHFKMKEVLVTEQKKTIEDLKSTHKAEIQALDDRYQAQKKIQQSLQAQLLDLHNRLGKAQKPVREQILQSAVEAKSSPERSLLRREELPGEACLQTPPVSPAPVDGSKTFQLGSTPESSAFRSYQRQAFQDVSGKATASRGPEQEDI